jgi:hypothetical protein
MNEFPVCSIEIQPEHTQYPLTTSLGTYSIMDATACIAGDCWGIYIQRNDNIESILNKYNEYDLGEKTRIYYINQPGVLINQVTCGDTLVIILYKEEPVCIQAKRLSELEWDIRVYIKIRRRFSFDSSDIQRMEEHQKEKYKKTIATLEAQIVELNKTIISLDSKHKSAIKMYQDAMLEKMTLQLAYEKLEKQVEKQEKVEMSATEQVQDTLKKDACCVC